MPTLQLHLDDFDAALLESLAESTGRSKSSLVSEALRDLHAALHDEPRVTRLSDEAFEDFLRKLAEPETDPKVLEARRRLETFVPVWER